MKAIEISVISRQQRNDLQRFFSFALEAAKRDENAVKYALKRSTSTLISPDNWDIYEAYVLRCAAASPNCLQTAVGIFATYKGLGYKLSSKRMRIFCTNIITECARSERHSEIAWALWLVRELSLSLPSEVNLELERVQSSVCALLTLDLRERGLIKRKLDTALWSSFSNSQGLRSGNWLLAYEGPMKGWLPGGTAFIGADNFYSEFLARNISFYDTELSLNPLIRRVENINGEDDVEFTDQADEYAA